MADPASLWPGYGIPAEQTPARSAEIRNALEALARNFFSTDAQLPTNPRNGQLRIFDEGGLGNTKLQYRFGGDWQTVLQNIQDDVPAPAKQLAAGFAAADDAPFTFGSDSGSKARIRHSATSASAAPAKKGSDSEVAPSHPPTPGPRMIPSPDAAPSMPMPPPRSSSLVLSPT